MSETNKSGSSPQLNVMVVGRTGTGKSTLINKLLEDRVAETRDASVGTLQIEKKSSDKSFITFYDTRGLELDSKAQKQSLKEIFGTIKRNANNKFLTHRIHCVLYCINPGRQRIEPIEIDWIKELTNTVKNCNIPVFVVLTQSFARPKAQEFKEYLESKSLGIEEIIPVLAEDYEISDTHILKAYGINDLMRALTPYIVYEDTENTLSEMNSKAKKFIVTAMTAAAAAAATPVPFADAAMLVPIQITMISGITSAYGLNLSKKIITAIVSAALGTTGTTIVGKTIVSTLLKLIPGIGSITGGVISAATASVLTKALGDAYIIIIEKIVRGELKESDLTSHKGKKMLSNQFKENLKNSKVQNA